MINKAPLLLFILLLSLCSCSSNPDGIIGRDKMEDILFDYHLTQSVLDIQPPEDNTRNQRYLDAVFTKHGVTEAQFDSSMIYYTREGTMLKEMYANLNKRFKDIEEALKIQSGNTNMILGLTENGDTANIWTAGSTIILRPSPLQNKEIFTIQNDSTLFLRKDKIRLLANCAFFKEIAEDRNSNIEIGITIEYKSGKTIGINRMVNANSQIELNLDATDNEDIKALHGFFFYTGGVSTRSLAIMTNIAVIRMHDKTIPPPAPEPATVDSIAVADSLHTDSANTAPQNRKHLSPEELLRQSRTKEHIEIKAAPDVRTKNSYGPKRKKASTPNRSK